jgi:hypothetical protein
MPLQLAIFTTHEVDAKLVIAINHSILRIFQKFKMSREIRVVHLNIATMT